MKFTSTITFKKIKPHKHYLSMKSACVIVAIISILLGRKSQAAVIVVLPTSFSPGSIQVTNDITFTMTVTDSIRAIVFDNWITSGSGSAQLLVTGPLSYRINSGPVTQNGSPSFPLIDRFTAAPGVLSADDGELNIFNVIPVTSGDAFTLVEQTLSIPIQSLSINPLAEQAFTGNLF
jgi:hypothetical protein